MANITNLALEVVAIFHKQNKFTSYTDYNFSLQQISSILSLINSSAPTKFLQTS